MYCPVCSEIIVRRRKINPWKAKDAYQRDHVSLWKLMEYKKVRSWQWGNHKTRIKPFPLCPVHGGAVLDPGLLNGQTPTWRGKRASRGCSGHCWGPGTLFYPDRRVVDPLGSGSHVLLVNLTWRWTGLNLWIGSLAEFNMWTLIWGLKGQED